MKLSRIKSFLRRQGGLTLIELMAAVAITGLISLGASVASLQLMNQTGRDNDYAAASRSALNAIHWISTDVYMAQSIDGCSGFPATDSLSLAWRGWDNHPFSANYTVTDGVLMRTYSDGVNISTTMIAVNINTGEDLTYCASENGTVTLTVTSSYGTGAKTIDVTKSRVIISRPKL